VKRQLATVLLCLLAASAVAQTDRLASPVSIGEKALRSRLEQTYPSVTQWEIVPFRPATASDTPLSGQLSAVVTRVGVRSAVWIAPRSAVRGSRGELLWYSVAGYGPAAVATRHLVKGAALAPDDGAISSGDLVAAGCPALTSPAALEGMRTKVSVGEGEVICTNAIEERPPVERGSEVTVHYAAGTIALTARAVAQQDGLMGKPILVRNTMGGEVFRATVSGRSEVRVDD
jgi:flagella basal body P-ring formation protein FlgA